MKFSLKTYLFIIFLLIVQSKQTIYGDTSHLTKKDIFAAAQQGNTHLFIGLIQQKQNLNILDEQGNTLVHIAAQHGHWHLIELLQGYAIPEDYKESMEYFSTSYLRPDIHAYNNKNKQAIDYALDNNDLDTVSILVWLGKKNNVPLLQAVQKGNQEITFHSMGMVDCYYAPIHDGDNILQIAINNGHTQLAKNIISLNNQVNAKSSQYSINNTLITNQNKNDDTPLFSAVKKNNIELVKTLLLDGQGVLTINKSNRQGCTPCAYLCFPKNTNDELLNILLSYKPYLNNSAMIPLHIALLHHSDGVLAEKLLSYGADINVKELPSGDTLLLKAVALNDRKKIEWLLNRNADMRIRNNNNDDALDVAIKENSPHLISLFIERGANINSVDGNGKNRLMKAIETKNNHIARTLIQLRAQIDTKDNNQNNPLHLAISHNNLEGAGLIMHHNPRAVNEQNKYGNTPIHSAMYTENAFDFIQLCTSWHADLDIQNNAGETALHLASVSGNIPVIMFLKANNANLSLLTADRNSAAHYAFIYKHFDSLDYLLCPDIANVCNKDNQTLLSLTIESMALDKRLDKAFLQKIVRLGASINMIANEKTGNTYLHQAIECNNMAAIELFAVPSLINRHNNDRLSPLSLAVRKNNIHAVNLFLHKHSSLDNQDLHGWTEMHDVAATGNVLIFNGLCQFGSSLNKRTDQGNTPLHIAAQHNNTDIIVEILKKDNNRVRQNDKGQTAFETAALAGNLAAAKLLITEDDFLNGKVNRVLTTLSSSSVNNPVTQFLKQKITTKNNEIKTVVHIRDRVVHYRDLVKVAQSILSQKAIKEHSHLTYEMTYSDNSCPIHQEGYLRSIKTEDLSNYKAMIEQQLSRLQKDYAELTKRIEEIDAINRQKELLAQAKNKHDQSVQLAQDTQNIAQPEVQNNEPKNENIAECDMCNEDKQDAQHRCSNDKCDKKICAECINRLKSSSNDSCKTCIYCMNPWK